GRREKEIFLGPDWTSGSGATPPLPLRCGGDQLPAQVGEQGRDGLDHAVAARFVGGEVQAERIRDVPLSALDELAHQEKALWRPLELYLDHRAMRLRHAEYGKGAIEDLLRQRRAPMVDQRQ